MTDREAMKMALEALEDSMYPQKKQFNAIVALKQALAQPEQKLNDPPAYVEPPTSDYHNGWEEGFEAAKNLFKKESAPQNADPRLLLGRKDNCIALAQPEQEPVALKMVYGEVCYQSKHDDQSFGMWCPITEREFPNGTLFYTTLPKREWVGLTVEEIRLMAHNDDKGDWNDLRFRSCWHNGYVDGVNAANAKLKELNK